MNRHWSSHTPSVERYHAIDSMLDGKRPIAFLIATNRDFNLKAFCDSLLESLRGSRLLQRTGKEKLLHLYLACDGHEAVRLPRNIRGNMSLTALPFHEQGENNIGAARRRQVELACLACVQLGDPILVVLDDDLTFEGLIVADGRPVKTYPFSFVHEIYLFERNHACDVALGGVTGAPPLPATSSMRTFLQDFLGVQSASKTTKQRWSDIDYYYDLSETRTCWESWPTLSPTNTASPVQHALNQMFHSGPENRPLVYLPSKKTPQSRIVRGGNTVVFNPEFLTKIDHPDLPRRGDSIWSILAKEQGATILEFPFPLYHTRNSEVNINARRGSKGPFITSLKNRMNDDLFGASIQRAMLNHSEFHRIYIGRLKRQLGLIKQCIELLQRAEEFIDDGSEVVGYWAMKLEDREIFSTVAKNILDALEIELIKQINTVEETTRMATLLIKALRYDARQTMEEGQ